MGVDGISGGGPPIPDAPAKGGVQGDGFAIGQGVEASAPTDLGRVEAGELSVDAYLDGRVQQATQHLESMLGPEQLQQLREELREQLSTDPVLQRLVQRSLGSSASEGSR